MMCVIVNAKLLKCLKIFLTHLFANEGHYWKTVYIDVDGVCVCVRQLVRVMTTLTTWPHAGTEHQSCWWETHSMARRWTCGRWVVSLLNSFLGVHCGLDAQM